LRERRCRVIANRWQAVSASGNKFHRTEFLGRETGGGGHSHRCDSRAIAVASFEHIQAKSVANQVTHLIYLHFAWKTFNPWVWVSNSFSQ
jgi:hypothetical protein